MNPHTHFLFPFAFALVLVNLGVFSWQLAILSGLIGMLVDLDHYIEHILHAKRNRFSLKATWNNSMKYHRFHQRSFIHDGKGVLLVTLLLLGVSIVSWQLALALGIGYYSHLLLDYVHLKKKGFVQWNTLHLHMKLSYEEIFLNILLCIFLFSLFIL